MSSRKPIGRITSLPTMLNEAGPHVARPEQLFEEVAVREFFAPPIDAFVNSPRVRRAFYREVDRLGRRRAL